MYPKDPSQGIILNIDINSVTTPFLNRTAKKPNLEKRDLFPFVDQYAETDVTALVFNIFCQYSATPSQVFTDGAALYEREWENGVSVCYHDYYSGIHRLNREYGLDPYALWVDRCHEKNLKAWISIRMNDAHCNTEQASFLRSDFHYEALEKGWMIGEEYGYFHRCFDYAIPQVRERMLAYIAEQVARLDLDALELDFMREPFCFDYLHCPEKCQIMNGFMRKVKAILSAQGEKRGRPISLAVRLPRDIRQANAWGFDPETWAREGLIDHVNITPRWECSDHDMPIEEWKVSLPGVPVSAGIETICLRNDDGYAQASTAVVNGLAAAYTSRGADAIYLFNYFLDPDIPRHNPYTKRTHEILRQCGHSEGIFSSPRRHIMLYQDLAPKGFAAYRPLPLTLEAGESGALSLPIGYLPKGKSCRLLVGLEAGSAEELSLQADGKTLAPLTPATFWESTEKNQWPEPAQGCDADMKALYIPSSVSLYATPLSPEGERVGLSFKAQEKTTISYIEIEIL